MLGESTFARVLLAVWLVAVSGCAARTIEEAPIADEPSDAYDGEAVLSSTSPLLRWRPPALVNPGSPIRLGNGATSTTLDPGRDYIIELPDTKKVGETLITGGHNIVIIGGYISMPPRPLIKHGEGKSIQIRNATGIVHIEGVLIDGSSGGESDGIRIQAPDAIVQLENMRIVGLRGTYDTGHADVIQPGGGVRELRIDRMTGASHYNDLYLRRENDPLKPPIGICRFWHVNMYGYLNPVGTNPARTLRAISIGTQGLDPGDASDPLNCEVTHPLYLNEFFGTPPSGGTLGQFVFPHDRAPIDCAAEVSADHTYVDWPTLRDEHGGPVHGVVRLGPPPGGDFVPAGVAGLHYVSPGYL